VYAYRLILRRAACCGRHGGESGTRDRPWRTHPDAKVLAYTTQMAGLPIADSDNGGLLPDAVQSTGKSAVE